MTAHITVVGNLGKDPEVKTSKNDKKFVVTSIAVNRGKGENETTMWFNCTAFGQTGKTLAEHTKKGSLLMLSGDFFVEEYEKEGEVRRNNKIVVGTWAFVPLAKKDEDKSDEPGEEPSPSDW